MGFDPLRGMLRAPIPHRLERMRALAAGLRNLAIGTYPMLSEGHRANEYMKVESLSAMTLDIINSLILGETNEPDAD